MIWFVLRKLAALVAIVLVTAAIVWWPLAAVPETTAQNNDFWSWLGHLLVGNFGIAASGDPVGALLAGRLAVTAPLALLALLIAAAAGIGTGWLAAWRPGSIGDRLIRALSQLGMAIPGFWVGMVLALAFATTLHWLPPGGFVPWQESPLAALASLILPAAALALPAVAAVALSARSAFAAAAGSATALGAQARGATRRDAVARSRRVALLSLCGPLAAQFAAIASGTVIVENVFYLPGLGRLILDAVSAHDLAALRAGLVLLVLLIAGILFATQLAFAWLDPRRHAEIPE